MLKRGIDFDSRNVDFQQEGKQFNQFEFTDTVFALNYNGL